MKERRKRRSAKDIEESIINAATRLIETEGFSNLTVTGVMRQAEIEPVQFYNRYDDLNKFIDDYVKKYVLIVGHFLASGLALLLLGVLWQRQLSYPLLYGAIFLLSSVDPLTHPSFQSVSPELVTANQLVAANATIQTIENCISVVGLIGRCYYYFNWWLYWLNGRCWFFPNCCYITMLVAE